MFISNIRLETSRLSQRVLQSLVQQISCLFVDSRIRAAPAFFLFLLHRNNSHSKEKEGEVKKYFAVQQISWDGALKSFQYKNLSG